MKPRTALSLIGRFLENIGKPILYLFLGFFYLFIFVSSKTGYFLYFLKDKIIALISSLKIPKFVFLWPKLRLPRLFVVGLLIFIIISAIFLTGYLTFANLPKPDTLITRNPPLTTKIFDRNGQLLYKIYRSQNRTLVKLENIPLTLQQAVIAVEDAEFYTHPGFSVRGIFRAFNKIIASNKIQGGSTITQQLVKNTLLSPEKTLKRKIQEIVLSVLVEKNFTKQQILQMYLNEVNFGGANYGVEEAAQTYFGKSVRDLDLAQSALLAGLPASPTTYSPYGARPELAKERQELVLDRMTQEGFIAPEQAQTAKEEILQILPQQKVIKAPHFVMFVKEQLVSLYGENMVEEGGMEVTTSLDLSVQEEAEKVVKTEVSKIQYLHVQNGAALVTKPATGEILAMVGSKDYFDINNQGNYNVTTALRQPGSSIKPVNYSVALSMGFTAASIIPDTPITYYVPGQPPYSPKNYDGRFRGNVSLRTALGSSLNVPAVKVLSAIGVSRMVDQGKKLGITTWDDTSRFGLSLTLGGGEVKMTDMAVVYGTLANLGNKVQLNPVLEVKDNKGKVLQSFKTATYEKVLSPEIAFILDDILSDNSARTPIFGSHSLLVIPGKTVAAKTGTTNNLKDNWAIGYTPSFVVLSWVGNNDSSPMSQVTSGVSGATPIWHNIMVSLLKNQEDQKWPVPESLTRVEICSTTNTLSCNGCGGRWEYFIKGTEPKISCSEEEIKKILEETQKK